MASRHLLVVAAMLLASAQAPAVVQVGPGGFVTRQEVGILAPPAVVYQALLGQVGAWWDSEHTYSGDSSNLSIDPRPGGCFCERLPNGGGVEHMRVLYVGAPETLRMAGALGPLQSSGLAGAMTWKLSATATGTRLELSYSVGGFMEGGFDRIAPLVEGMLGGQVQRLKRFVETGRPAAK